MQTLTQIKKDLKAQYKKIDNHALDLIAKEKQAEQQEDRIAYYKELVDEIPTDIIIHQLQKRLMDNYVLPKKNLNTDTATDDFRQLIERVDRMVNDLETIYTIEKAKRLRWL